MAENTTIRDSFFDSLQKGAKWDVGVSINRTNPLPLDQYSVFKTEAELNTYIAGAFSYPGQIVALVGETETVIYYLAEKADHSGLEKIEVGSMPGVDNKSIKIEIDETTGDEYLTLVGLEKATVGASLIKLEDGSIGWSSTTQEGLTADLTGIKADISELNTTVYGVADGTTAETGLVSKVTALENKFTSMGGVFNFAGSVTVDVEHPMPSANLYDIGDVLLVNGKEEWVCIADASNPGNNKWEPFGDPDGVTELKGTVQGHTSSITDLQGRMTSAEGKIGAEATTKEVDGEIVQVPASGLYAYADTVAANKASAAQAAAVQLAAEALSPVSTKANENAAAIVTINTNLALKANASEVDAKFTEVNNEIAKKADATETTNALNERATKTELTNGLAGKVDTSTFNTVTGEHTTKIGAAEQKITALETAVGQADGEGKYPATSLTGRVAVLEATDITHNQDISGLKAGLGTNVDVTVKDESGNYKDTAFGQAGKAQALATAANTAAGVAQAAAEVAQTTANGAQSAAEAAQTKANAAYELAETKVDTNTYTGKISEIEGNIEANATAITLRATTEYVNTELGKKVDQTAYDTKVGEIEGAIALKAATADVEEELAKKADKTSTETAIKEINDKIGSLGNVMNFIGKLTTDESGNITTVGEHGDVGYVGDFEYVYVVTGEGETAVGKWEKFGDTSVEGERISALEAAVGNLDNSGLIKAVADLQAEDVAIKATASALSTSVDSRFSTVNETLASLDANKVNVSAYNEKIAALEAADAQEAKDRDDAVKAEASARSTAISTLETYINDALSWGSFDPAE